MTSNTGSEENHLETENIFDEFASVETQDEIKKQEEKKDLYDYLSIGNKVLVSFNIFFICALCVGFLYLHVQKQAELKEYSYLTPVCNLFLGDASYGKGSCYGVFGYHDKLTEDFEAMKTQQANEITPLLGELYALENFNYSKKVSFLLERSVDRMKPLSILTEFDELKNTYSPIDKSEIQCYSISFLDKKRIQMTCDAYSSDWDTAIAALNDGVLEYENEGTSISRAISFIDYLQNAPGGNFVVNSYTENLSSTKVQLGPYTQKTTFQLELEYHAKNLSL